jgi:hypothetical protein
MQIKLIGVKFKFRSDLLCVQTLNNKEFTSDFNELCKTDNIGNCK